MKNKVNLMGRLTRDLEVKEFESGAKVVNLTLATNEYYTDKNGEKQEKTEFHNLKLWGKMAEIAEKLKLRKGSLIDIEGRLIYEEAEKEGKKIVYPKIEVKELILISHPKEKKAEEEA